MESWEFDAELWPHDEDEPGSWTFLTVPEDVGEGIGLLAGPRTGFGSVRVEVTVGTTTWRTSVFPDRQRGYVLPVKKGVRRWEGVEAGDIVHVRLALAG